MQGILDILAILMPRATVAGLSIAQWEVIVGALLALEPDIAKLISDAHPIFATVFRMKDQGMTAPQIAAAMPTSIPGYGPDGAVTGIPNPDRN
jgi:hypothetical protein